MLNVMKAIWTLLLGVFLLAMSDAHAEVRLPDGSYYEVTNDLHVKVMGGYVTVARTWYNGLWYFNSNWDDLSFSFDSIDGSVQSITRAGSEYKLTSPGVYVLDSRNTIRSKTTGYRWQDRKGNWVEFDSNGKIQSYGDRNNVKVTFQYDGAGKRTGVLDHFGTQVLWYEYTNNALSAIRDYTNRRVQYQYTGSNLTKITDFLGNAWVYTYDSANKLLTKTDPENRKTTVTYTANGKVASVKDSDNIGPSYAYDYDSAKRQFYIKETSPAGRVTGTLYDAEGQVIQQEINGKSISSLSVDGRVKSTKDQRGLTTITEYDEWDNLLKSINADGSTVTNKFDPIYSNLLESINEIGIITKYEYDTKGNLIRLTEAQGKVEQRVTEYAYDTYGNRTQIKWLGDAVTQEAATTYAHDNYGNVTTVTDAEGKYTKYTYDVMGNALSVTDSLGKVWGKSFDVAGKVIQQIDPLGRTINIVYDKVGNRIKITDARGNITTFVYDSRNNLLSITNPLNAITRYEYDKEGRRIKEIDAEGKIAQYAYDVDGRPIKKTDGNNNEFVRVYGDELSGLNGLLIKLNLPTFSQEYKYDERNRVVEVVDVLSGSQRQSTKMQYDASGRLIAFIDKKGNVIEGGFDGLGRLLKVRDALLGSTTLIYDNRDNVLSIKDANGGLTKYAYDRNNRKTQEVNALGQVNLFTYDGNGNLASKLDAKGQVRKYIYDAANRRIEDNFYASVGADTTSKKVAYGFDANGNLVSYSDGSTVGLYAYDSDNRKINEEINYGSFKLTASYSYYLNGKRKNLTYPNGASVSYSYDANNQLSNVQLPNGAISISNYQWFEPKTIVYPGGTVREQNYDPLMRLTKIVSKDPSQLSVMSNQYDFDKVENLTSKTTEHGDYQYTYDNLNRLTQVNSPATAQENFTYDALGNRLTDSRAPGAWNYNQNNQLASFPNVSLQYDENGNLVKRVEGAQSATYKYDVGDRLVEIGDGNGSSTARYSYDPFARRIAKEVNGVTTYYFYTDEGLVAEANSSGEVTTTYGYRPDGAWMTDPLFLSIGGNFYFYQNDNLGVPQKIVDGTGKMVWSAKSTAFGELTVDAASTIVSNLRFPGQYFDAETGLHYNIFRYYDPRTGRYLQSDPVGLSDGPNSYLYARAAPTKYVDPLGLTVSGSWAYFPKFTLDGADFLGFTPVDPTFKPKTGALVFFYALVNLKGTVKAAVDCIDRDDCGNERKFQLALKIPLQKTIKVPLSINVYAITANIAAGFFAAPALAFVPWVITGSVIAQAVYDAYQQYGELAKLAIAIIGPAIAKGPTKICETGF